MNKVRPVIELGLMLLALLVMGAVFAYPFVSWMFNE